MNKAVQIEITTLGAHGDGIGAFEGVPVFVTGTMPGDIASVTLGPVKKNGYNAELIKLDTPSKDRSEPVCKVFGKCGGCQLQYLPDAVYRAWLKARASMALEQHGFKASVVSDPIITPQKSRRRVALKVLKMGKGVVIGFTKKQTHQIVDVKDCPVTRLEITDLIAPLRKLLTVILPNRVQGELHITLTSTGIDILVDAPVELTLAAREQMVDFANTHDIAAIHWRDQGFLDPVIIRRVPMMDMSGVHVPLAPAAFIQASEEGERALVAEVVAACSTAKRVVDLFSGIGTFTFPLAKTHQILTVEGAKPAYDALQMGVKRAAGLKQIIAKHRDLYRRPLTGAELAGFDAVVFDPPRAGAKEQVLELAQSDVQTIVGVSCNPNTFSRDARILADGGYTLNRVVPVGQFLWSTHLELVSVFTKA